jgi:hypothetical protein
MVGRQCGTTTGELTEGMPVTSLLHGPDIACNCRSLDQFKAELAKRRTEDSSTDLAVVRQQVPGQKRARVDLSRNISDAAAGPYCTESTSTRMGARAESEDEPISDVDD